MAETIGNIRTNLSSSFYQDGSERDRGERESEIQTKGVLAELIAREYLLKTNYNYTLEPLIEFSGILNPNASDLFINNKNIDIKYGNDNLNVNYKKHNLSSPDFYWFIVPISEVESESYLFESSEALPTINTEGYE